MAKNTTVLDFDDITKLFGLRSSIFSEAISFLEKKSISQKWKYEEKYSEWRKVFKNIYGDDIDAGLFLRHTYLALILKVLISTELSVAQNLDLEDAYEDCMSLDLESLLIFEFEKYFNWINFNKKIFKKIYNQVENTTYAKQDLFHELYQQIIFAVTRHKIGEFYTPIKLVKKMVDDFYVFGAKIMDPSCGSGSFLIETIVKILNSDESDELKRKAIKNVHGIDINPLATATAKVNIFLLLLENLEYERMASAKIMLIDSLFPEQYENDLTLGLKKLYGSFDLILGNPPWLTYKDLTSKKYQIKIRELAKQLGINPSSQYITHIELAAMFFYAIPNKFLKVGGKIFFVITKSVLNGDHCHKFRAFSQFKNLEIWDFPNYYFLKIDHICLKAEYTGQNDASDIQDKYPIKAKQFNDDLILQKDLTYSSINIRGDGARLILPDYELKVLNKIENSDYKPIFFQGATLVPRALIFFQVDKKEEENLMISSDPEILSRSKKNWRHTIERTMIEAIFRFKTFLNKDLIPFFIKRRRDVFLPINRDFIFNQDLLVKNPKALKFFNEMDNFYKEHKKKTSDILTLFDNINYWNKLTKQGKRKNYLVVYNASGSNLKAAVIDNRKNVIIIGSENYYFSTDIREEAFYLSGILNSPIIAKSVRLIKSSRHIHKRPFSFPIPLFDESNEVHQAIAKKAIKCETIAQDLFFRNKNINADKIRIITRQKLIVIDELVEKLVFK